MNDLQRTEEWYQDRLGHLTASVASDVLEGELKKGGYSAKYYDRMYKLIAERMTGKPAEDVFVNPQMQWGIDHEADAVSAYEIATGSIVEMAGFIKCPDVEWLGASPDGLVGNDGLIEIKCPNTITHLKRMNDNCVPEDRKPQMLVQLICTGRKWCDFVDFDPRIEEQSLQLMIQRFEPTEKDRTDALEKIKQFLKKTEEKYQYLQKLYEGK